MLSVLSGSSADVEHLSYNELRKLAKQLGIRANQKADKLRSEISSISNHSTELVSTDTRLKPTPVITECVPIVDANLLKPQAEVLSPALLALEYVTKRSAPVISAKLDSLDEVFTEDKEESGTSSENSSSASQILNRTYELTEPTMLVNAPEIVPDCAVSSHLTTFKTGELQSCMASLPTSGYGDASCGDNRKEPHPRLPPPPKQLSVVRAVPDFSRIHAASAARMESLVEFVDRRQRQKEQLTQPTTLIPFVSPPRRNTMLNIHPMASSRAAGALVDASNRPLGRDSESSGSSSGASGSEKSIIALTRSNSVLIGGSRSTVADFKSTGTVKTTASTTSAFARRKAYDLASRRQRLSGTLTGDTNSVNRSCNEKDPKSYQTSKFVTGQLHQKVIQSQQLRVQARQNSVDTRRGLL